eukprot:TRINITY_DN12007_c0_g1_i2.p1 TRINITY_DN12007_c0_g1~~TRINITY_DN12007_c0_g1_i2.p1  ORF type:complete len:586 (+),score=94.50 TRINITY_DN12007_c0_g1_i2:40-1797(+)
MLKPTYVVLTVSRTGSVKSIKEFSRLPSGLEKAVRVRRVQRRGYGYGMPPPPPPPPPPPLQGGFPSQSDKGPVIIQVRKTRGEVVFQLLWFGLAAGVVLLFLYELEMGRSARGDRDGLLRSSSKIAEANLEEFQTTFSEILGCDEAKEELEEIVMFLKDPDRFTRLGGKLPKGALLVGPPGTGKTLLAKAIAKEAGVPFFYMSGAEFDEVYVGVGSKRVRELFEAAKSKNGPSLIFIDEIDAIGGKRSPRDQSYHRMTLNQLLSEMDGFLSSDKVVVIGATNTPKSLDPALTRPGRLDRIISVDPPDCKGREAILKLYLSKVAYAPDIDAGTLAKGLPGYCGADLHNIVNMAAIKAAMDDREVVGNEELEFAKDRVSMGAENRSKIIPEKERKVTAWHEAGHALTAMLSEGADPVHKATIIPRGSGILGLVLQHPTEDRYSMSRQMMLSRLRVALAGRAAEEVLLGHSDVTAGAASDFETATALARSMVRRYGMAEESLGVVDYSTSEDYSGAYLSEETKVAIELATRNLLDEAFKEAASLLNDNHSKLKAIAEALLEHETLSRPQLDMLLEGKTLPPPEKKLKR